MCIHGLLWISFYGSSKLIEVQWFFLWMSNCSRTTYWKGISYKELPLHFCKSQFGISGVVVPSWVLYFVPFTVCQSLVTAQSRQLYLCNWYSVYKYCIRITAYVSEGLCAHDMFCNHKGIKLVISNRKIT